MFEIGKNAKEIAETLWSLKETLVELRTSCELLGRAVEKQEDRLRSVEGEIVALRAELKVSASEARLAAVERAGQIAGELVSNVHGPLVQKVSEMKVQVDCIDKKLRGGSSEVPPLLQDE